MNSHCKFSFIVCTRNRAQSLSCALLCYEKIKSLETWELIVVDNDSTDDTHDIIESFRGRIPQLRATFCKQKGLGAAREHGRKVARGEILVFTDDDCYPEISILDSYAKVFLDEKISFAGGKILLWDETDAHVTVDYRDAFIFYPKFEFVPAGSLHGANLAIRRNALNKIGGFDTALGAGTEFPCEDIDVIGRLIYSGFEGCFSPLPTVYHHHGRKDNDVPQLIQSYDKGRGAYVIKMFLNKPSRKDTVLYYFRYTLKRFARNPKYALNTLREIRQAIRYLKSLDQ